MITGKVCDQLKLKKICSINLNFVFKLINKSRKIAKFQFYDVAKSNAALKSKISKLELLLEKERPERLVNINTKIL